MIQFLPSQISSKAIYLYLGSLAAVSLFFYHYAMSLPFLVMGVVWVVSFFVLTSLYSRKWSQLPTKRLLRNLALAAFGIRLVWVLFSYYFYTARTGMPFEFSAADALGYWEDSVWLSYSDWGTIRKFLFTDRTTISDSGYLLYLTYLAKLIGPGVMGPRLVKCLWGTATVLLLYRLAARNIGEEAGRMAGVMACFMPNLVIYCGLHLKETEMLFLLVAFLERSDYLIRSHKFRVLNLVLPVLLAVALFSFRTVLGAAAVFSLATALVFTGSRIIGRGRRVMLIAWGLLAVATFMGGTIRSEVESTWEDRGDNLQAKRAHQTAKGNRWAQYATGTVMAPMMFVLPFPTMVDVDQQYNQQVMSGGNYVRTFLGCFVLIAMFSALFVTKNWRSLSLIGSYVIAYLGIVSASGFSNSERFLLPALPGLLVMAAYGISLLNARYYRFVKAWYWVVPLICFAWAFFKLGSRGLF